MVASSTFCPAAALIVSNRFSTIITINRFFIRSVVISPIAPPSRMNRHNRSMKRSHNEAYAGCCANTSLEARREEVAMPMMYDLSRSLRP